jgi:excisionase family DNA binding protein
MATSSEMSGSPVQQGQKFLTTEEAAVLFSLAPRTVTRGADVGMLRSHRTGGGHHRLLRSDLLAFMRERGMPIPDTEDGSAPRVVIVDNEREDLRAIQRVVERVLPSADCRSASDGYSASALVTAFRPDLVFLDLVLPGLSGVAVCRHLRTTQGFAGIAIVIISSHLDAWPRAELEHACASRLIAKPFSSDDIERALVDFAGPAAASSPKAPARARGVAR